jgi:hypothetical protein
MADKNTTKNRSEEENKKISRAMDREVMYIRDM